MDKSLVNFLKNLIYKAGTIALEARQKGLEVNKKLDKSLVSNADLLVSNFIYQELESLGLNFPIICEERAPVNVENHEYFWLIDPIDGTSSYVKNHDNFTVNIALIHNKKASNGFILHPVSGKLYYTDEENRLQIEENGRNTSRSNMHDGFIAIVSSHHLNSETRNYLKLHEFTKIIAISSSIKLCMIADGCGDVFPKFGPTMEWDTAAGHALIKASGGNIIAPDGQELLYAKSSFRNPNFIAANCRWLKHQSVG